VRVRARGRARAPRIHARHRRARQSADVADVARKLSARLRKCVSLGRDGTRDKAPRAATIAGGGGEGGREIESSQLSIFRSSGAARSLEDRGVA